MRNHYLCSEFQCERAPKVRKKAENDDFLRLKNGIKLGNQIAG
nr:MAG TPA: hypothetical protein [Caudoviricetes sp.]